MDTKPTSREEKELIKLIFTDLLSLVHPGTQLVLALTVLALHSSLSPAPEHGCQAIYML